MEDLKTIKLGGKTYGVTPASHAQDKNDPHEVTPEQIGARSNTWLPTPAQIGATPALDWSHLKWYVMGDSLTAQDNDFTDKRYYDFVQEKTGIQVIVDGVGATGYKAGESEGQSFLDRVKNIPEDVDIVTIFGSGNDLSSTDLTYANAAIYDTLAWILFNRTGLRVIVVPPTPWKNYDKRGEVWKAYCDRLQVCALACDFRYLSEVYDYPPFNGRYTGHMEKFFTNDPNGVHPNEEGHKALAPYFYNALLQELALDSDVETPGGGGSGQNVNPVPKTDDMTQPVGVDADGRLWVAPIGGGSSGGDTEVTTHGVVWDLVNVTSSNAVTSVSDGASLSAVLTAAEGYTLGDVTVTMGGEALTGVWNADTATVTIASVTGDVIISCAGVAQTGPVDTSPVIAQEGVGYNASGATKTFSGIGITKTYALSYDHDAIAAKNWYDAENDYVTQNGVLGLICTYTPSVKMAEAGYSQSGLTVGASKVVAFRDEAIATIFSNASLTSGASPVSANLQTPRQNTDYLYATGISFSVSLLDADDSYAYWSAPTVGSSTDSPLLPIGVRSGDIIFAGKNTQYYGMANIDGTMAGGTSTASVLSFDDDVAQNYAVATASILGEETASDTIAAYGISAELATVIDQVRNAWMIEYGGDYRKIPLVITTDQHGGRNAGIFNMLGKTLSLHDVSKICNLGDTVSEWADADSAHPLLSDEGLEKWCESIKAIPFSKRLDVFGNHDTWYGNYEDEGNPIGTRYPANQAHLYQYFRNIYARRTNNNGWFVVKDDTFNVKYVVISGFEYAGTVTFRIGTKQMKFIIDEFSKDDGYDIVVVSHVPLHYKSEEMTFPTGHEYTIAEDYRVADIDTDILFAARKNKTSGTVTDSDGVSHSYDFAQCNTDVLCALHGHTHHDAYNYVGTDGLLSVSFDWFDGNTIHFVLIDRENRQLNVWKVDNTPQVQNYQIPFDKTTE